MKEIVKRESPKNCQVIANGLKTILLSKTAPKVGNITSAIRDISTAIASSAEEVL